MGTEAHWEQEAQRWMRWARAPGHDAYWRYSPAFFDAIVPQPGRRTLEVGCGEGRVARDLRRRGHQVIALDRSRTLVRYAQAADPDGRYLVADAAALPFPDASFDLVVAYNSLMDVADMPAVVAEAGRVLETGKPLCISVTHPVSDAGSFAGREPDAPFVISKEYLGRRWFEGTYERDGLQMTFRGWAYQGPRRAALAAAADVPATAGTEGGLSAHSTPRSRPCSRSAARCRVSSRLGNAKRILRRPRCSLV